jgi:purine-binding chemotaxis protein CheW
MSDVSTSRDQAGPAGAGAETRQFSTFFIGSRLYGIDVMKVQEVTKALPMTPVPLAPKYVHGLINLRGQISTAISLRDLFQLTEPAPQEQMNVVCRVNDLLVSFLVDKIGDVIEVSEDNFQPTPDTLSESIRRFMSGVFKIPGELLSVLEVEKVTDSLVHQPASSIA